jgi:hypothetical protein
MLRDVASSRLSFCTGRRVDVNIEQSSCYWNLILPSTPLSKKELKILLQAYKATDQDRERNDFGECPITAISQGLSTKIISAELPFTVESSHTDEDGVWFVGASGGDEILVRVHYPEIEVESDVVRFTLSENTTKGALLDCINKTAAALRRRKDDDDYSTRLDELIARVKNKTGCDGSVVYTNHDVNIG